MKAILIWITIVLIAILVFLYFDLAAPILFWSYIAISVIVSLILIYINYEAIYSNRELDGIKFRLLVRKTISKNYKNKFLLWATLLFSSLKLGFSFPITFGIGILRSKQLQDNKSKLRAYSELHPIHVNLAIFFLLMLSFLFLTTLVLEIQVAYSREIIIILLVLVVIQMLEFIFSFENLIETYANSAESIKLNVVVLIITSFFSLVISYTMISIDTGQIQFERIVSIVSDMIGYKKLRLWYYGIEKNLETLDILIASTGTIFSISLISSLRKVFFFKRQDSHKLTIAERFLECHSPNECIKWLDKMNYKQESYWQIRAYALFLLFQFKDAISSYKKSLIYDDDPYFKDYTYYRLGSEIWPYIENKKVVTAFFEFWITKLVVEDFISVFVRFHPKLNPQSINLILKEQRKQEELPFLYLITHFSVHNDEDHSEAIVLLDNDTLLRKVVKRWLLCFYSLKYDGSTYPQHLNELKELGTQAQYESEFFLIVTSVLSLYSISKIVKHEMVEPTEFVLNRLKDRATEFNCMEEVYEWKNIIVDVLK